MLRFKPDDLLEGLLRPLTMVDPAAGIYLEFGAPDWRFAATLVLFAIGLLAARGRLSMNAAQVRFVASMAVAFFIWTFAVGNGRYFVFGLLLAGPLTVLAWRKMPGTLAFRTTTLVGLLALQLVTVQQNHPANPWGEVRWYDGPGLPIADTPLRTQPAVFLSISALSYSLLVPSFHPESRWANIAGQRDIAYGTKEYPRLFELLSSHLPKYLVARASKTYVDPAGQPAGDMRAMFERTLAERGLALSGAPCELVRTALASPPPELADRHVDDGFWFCRVQASTSQPISSEAARNHVAGRSEVFAAVEASCSRFFPPGDGQERQSEGMTMRYYPESDVRVYIDEGGVVSYKYYRAFNPTLIGTVEQIRRGDFAIACEKLPGRYQLPWQRE